METVALTIAGSDSSGGAGIQADLATFLACGCRGATVVTAVTAQGARGVVAAETVSAELVRTQLRTILEDLAPGAIKTGMLATPEVVGVVADELRRRKTGPLVCDPVVMSTSGHALLAPGGLDALREELLPLCALVTPNVDEARRLTGLEIGTPDQAEEAARGILEMGPGAVLVKGGHLTRGRGTDVLVTGRGTLRLEGKWIDVPVPHGTGCVLSAAICAHLAGGAPLEEAVRRAKRFVTRSLQPRATLPAAGRERLQS